MYQWKNIQTAPLLLDPVLSILKSARQKKNREIGDAEISLKQKSVNLEETNLIIR